MKTPARKIAFPALLAGLVVLVVVGVDFGVTRTFRKLKSSPPVTPLFPRERHPVYHHGLRPNSEGWAYYGPIPVYYFSNSLGMRDAKIRDVPLVPAGRRIVLMGDSFTEGVGVPWEETFAGILGKALAPKGVEVLNAGVSSYSPKPIHAKLRYLIEERGLGVDRVVIFVDVSDVVDELFYYTKSDGTVGKSTYGPFQGRAEQLTQVDEISNWLKLHIEGNFSLLGAISRNLRLLWREHHSSEISSFEKLVELKHNWPDYHGELGSYVDQGLAEAKREMTGITDFLRSRHIPLTAVIYPWPEQIRSGTRPSRLEREWSAWARQNQVTLVNLFPLFVNGTPAEEVIRKFYIPKDFHWSAAGNALVAETLLKNPETLQVGGGSQTSLGESSRTVTK